MSLNILSIVKQILNAGYSCSILLCSFVIFTDTVNLIVKLNFAKKVEICSEMSFL